MRVIGIDPGSVVFGYGLIEQNGSALIHLECGCHRIRDKSSFAARLKEIFVLIQEVLERFSPQAVAVEKVFVAHNVMSALKLGESRGVALLAASLKELPVYEYSTREIKQAVTGYGQADKPQIQKMVQKILKLPEVAAEDASDALAVAICHAQSEKMRKAVARSV